ncbi:uncharacterized protein LOC126746327 isoform X2 [Anthonomus grandis grandis]|uniref:uncharacterized protein LOC126746327 isoform X2 n=1 Tax=Anthonomus grandis grandis TaxID=2921223 RepID=UPI002166B2CF|nr:uncharacterized protein LOC126746327 isoform X2 [Anthonomus grandis grandis]
MGPNYIPVWCTLLGMASTGWALQCFKCGQYNDGVGSITPCINDTYMKLEDCPRRDMNYCIKYMSEGTVVRDCVVKCTEKDNWDWNSRTFCCTEDACNSAHPLLAPLLLLLLTLLLGGAQAAAN